MFDKNQPLTKRYYTIGEVAEMFEVSTSLIRFWEQEFDSLKPHKNAKGERRFTPDNVLQFNAIYELVKKKGYTLNGAAQEIDRQKSYRINKEKTIKRLKNIRAFMVNMKAQFKEI